MEAEYIEVKFKLHSTHSVEESEVFWDAFINFIESIDIGYGGHLGLNGGVGICCRLASNALLTEEDTKKLEEYFSSRPDVFSMYFVSSPTYSPRDFL